MEKMTKPQVLKDFNDDAIKALLNKPLSVIKSMEYPGTPFSGNLDFVITDYKAMKNGDDNVLFIYVPKETLNGSISNPRGSGYSDVKAMGVAIISRLAYHELLCYMEDIDILVYFVPIEEAIEQFFK